MKIQELQQLYALSPRVKALADVLGKKSEQTIFLEGLVASSLAMTFAALHDSKLKTQHFIFIMQDAEEAGYLYHDLQQLLGDREVLYFPSSYRRSVKYGQRDAANEILRTEVLARLSDSQLSTLNSQLFIVTYPEAVAEQVVSKKRLDERTLALHVGQTINVDAISQQLRDFGFHEVDYVYEPGQFALRGSILDVFSFSSEYPFRVDFFGDDIDSIRTFEVENQLSRDKREQIEIVPELSGEVEDRVSLLSFVPKDTILVMKDQTYVREVIDRTYDEGFSAQAIKERTEGATEQEQQEIIAAMRKEVQLTTGSQFQREALELRRVLLNGNTKGSAEHQTSSIKHQISPQPLFHKNFELLHQTLEDYAVARVPYLYTGGQPETERATERDSF